MKTFLILFWGIFVPLSISSQPAITYSNFITVNDTLLCFSCDTAGIMPGDSGQNVTWDYSTLRIRPNTHYYIADTLNYDNRQIFSNGTIQILYQWSDEFINYINVNSWYSIYKQDSTEIIYLGAYGKYTGLERKLSNTKIIMRFPMVYGTNFGDYYSSHQSQMYKFMQGNINIDCDAWGKLILPDTIFTSVLRVKTTDKYTVTKSWPNNNDVQYTYKITEYHWWDPNTRMPVFSIIYKDITFPNGNTIPHIYVHIRQL